MGGPLCERQPKAALSLVAGAAHDEHQAAPGEGKGVFSGPSVSHRHSILSASARLRRSALMLTRMARCIFAFAKT